MCSDLVVTKFKQTKNILGTL